MDDYDTSCNRVKIARDYSFSPSKTPSKDARDELLLSRLKQNNVNQEIILDQDPYSPEWDNSQYRYSKTKHFGFKQNRTRAENTMHFDIEGPGFRMKDQPNIDGVDQYITIWCTWDDDPDNKPYLCRNARRWTELMKGDSLHYNKMK